MVSGKKVPEPFLIEFLVGISLKIQLKNTFFQTPCITYIIYYNFTLAYYYP